MNHSLFFLQLAQEQNWVMTPDEKARILNVCMIIGIGLALIYVFFKVRAQQRSEKKLKKRESIRKRTLKAQPVKHKIAHQKWNSSIETANGKLSLSYEKAGPEMARISNIERQGDIESDQWKSLWRALNLRLYRQGFRELSWINMNDQIPEEISQSERAIKSKKITEKLQRKGIQNWWVLSLEDYRN